MNCPSCNAVLGGENINIQTDLAHCPSCNHIFKISDAIVMDIDTGFDINNPPKGAWIRKDMDQMVVGATTRSPIAFFLVPFMCIWSGGSLGGIYGSQILSGEFDPFMSLFGIPFLIGSVIFWSLALMSIWGKVEVTFDKRGGKVFTGVWQIGLTKKFAWDDISNVSEAQTAGYSTNNGFKSRRSSTVIRLEGKRRITFGTGLNESRRYYLLMAVKNILGKKKSGRSRAV